MPDYLYIHIPFCVRKCIYCDFVSIPFNKEFAEQYVDGLCSELKLKKKLGEELKSIYIGGGTPSILSEIQFSRIFGCIKENYHISHNAEITIEANPGTISREKIETFLSLGVNRLSIGVQSFNDRELQTLGRIHTADEAKHLIQGATETGIKNLSLDLIYGIPGQTLSSWKESISQALSLSPKHISAYELTPEKGTPLDDLLGQGKLEMPCEELILNMYDLAGGLLTDHGYEHYEISNYALPGYKCIHNLNYWERGEYIGVGAGAHSLVNGRRFNNTADINDYIEKFSSGIPAEQESFPVSEKDALKELIFLGLRKTEGIKINNLINFGCNISSATAELEEQGFIEISGDYIRLTRKGLPISNTIIVRLFEKLGL